MTAKDILREAEDLRAVSDSLEQLASGSETMGEALTVLAATVRQSATMLEVMVEVRLGGAPDQLRPDRLSPYDGAPLENRSN